MTDDLPIIDMSGLLSEALADRMAVAAALGRACRGTGFFYVTGHGVAPATMTALFAEAKRFFDLPLRDRQALSIHRNRNNRGYFGLTEEHLDPAALPDHKEGINIGLELDPSDPEFDRPFRGENYWPDLPGWREVMLGYFDLCVALGRTLHRGFCLDLGLAEDFFEPALDRPIGTLRLLRYPPAAGGSTAAPGAARGAAPGAGEHTDYGNITILAVDGVGGLQLRRRDGVWIDAPTIPGAFIVNIGDCLMRWTDDAYVSTPHRVSVPQRERLSIAFFLDPNPDVIVAPVLGGEAALTRYPPISGADYLRFRIDPTYKAA